MKQRFLRIKWSIVSLLFIECIFWNAVFADGKYNVINEQGQYIENQYIQDTYFQWVRAKMEPVSQDGLNYMKVTLEKYDESADSDDEYKNTFRCDGTIIVRNSLAYGTTTIHQTTSFNNGVEYILFQKGNSQIIFYILTDSISSQQWNTLDLRIITTIRGNTENNCPRTILEIGPFTIEYKESKPVTEDDTEDPIEDPEPVIVIEKPAAPELVPIAVSLASDHFDLRWIKVLDSHYKHNAKKYIIEYYRNYLGWENAVSIDAGNPSTESNLYETLSYPITGLDDDVTYHFRVKAVNDSGDGFWSNEQSVVVRIEDRPYFQTDHFPDNDSLGVSKMPELRWSAFDPDGDELDYNVTLGESENDLKTLRSFKDAEHQGEDIFNFSQEDQSPLKPNTQYFWQIWVRENGRTKDYYGGEYIKSPIWSFTTEKTGADPSITNVVQVGELKPDSGVLFQVTVKNSGTESIGTQRISCSYIKNNIESPFYNGSGRTLTELAPNQAETIDIIVRFKDNIWVKNNITYDNVLVSGDSQINFYFSQNDDQDIDITNNAFVKDIHYESTGAPEVSSFELREYRQYVYGSSASQIFWARTGKELEVIVKVKDDIKVTRGIIEFRPHVNAPWQTLLDQTNNYEYFHFSCDTCSGDTFSWIIPEDSVPTDDAQIRVRFFDDANEETIKVSDAFSIYSSRMDTSIEANNSSYKVTDSLDYSIQNDSDYSIRRYEVKLFYGDDYTEIARDSNDTGLSLINQQQWQIPDDNRYMSDFCYLELYLVDIYGNSTTVMSDKFSIKANTELPAPFNKSVLLFNEEVDIPDDAMFEKQSQSIQFLEIDENNIVHAVVKHYVRYFMNTGSGYAEDTLYYSDDKYYITYDPSNGVKSSKIKICDKQYELLDFSVVDTIPFVLLKKPDESVQYYYTYKKEESFETPENIENPIVPEIESVTKIAKCDEIYPYEPYRYILAKGYIWKLNFNTSINRYSFSNGSFGSEESITVQNSEGSLVSYDVKPKTDGNFIYFIDPFKQKLVRFNTSNYMTNAYSLPFSTDKYSARKISILAKEGQVFVFGNGKVFALENSALVEKGNITYTFNGETVDYSNEWSEIYFVKTFQTENKIILYLGLQGYFPFARPRGTYHEILEFNASTYKFEKRIVESNSDLFGTSNNMMGFMVGRIGDYQYIGNNQVLVIFTSALYSSSSFPMKYYTYLKILNLETGAVDLVGQTEIQDVKTTALISSNNNLYVIGSIEIDPYHINSYKLSIKNTQYHPKQVEDIQLLQVDNKLYASWYQGNTFDGRWDFHENLQSNRVLRKNKFVSIYPSHGMIRDFYQDYMGDGQINLSSECLTVDGKLFSLNSELTVKNLLHDFDDEASIDVNNFHPTVKAAFSDWSDNILLIEDDFSNPYAITSNVSKDNTLGIFDDDIIIVGQGKRGEYYDKYVIKKYDLNSRTESIVTFNERVRDFSRKRVDINQNKHIALAWDNFIAVADYSGDVIAPNVSFSSSAMQVSQGDIVQLIWQASDNKDDMDRLEIFKNDSPAPLVTLTDTSITSYDVIIDQTTGSVTYKIKVYDSDENSSSDTLRFHVFTPASFNDFSANKRSLEMGDSITFNWKAEYANESTEYTVYKKKAGSNDWEQYFSVTGQTNHQLIVDGFIGDYQFMISADGNSMALTETIHIDGEIVEFDDTAFSQTGLQYYLEQPEIDLQWGVYNNLSDIVSFDIYIKHQDETAFQKVATTTDSHYLYDLPEDKNNIFQWKIIAQFRGDQYESKSFSMQIMQLISPDVQSVRLLNNHTKTPSTVITFNLIDMIGKYAIMRRDSEGNYLEIGQTESCIYTDTTIQYDKQYEYSVCSIADNIIGDPGKSQVVFIGIKPVYTVLIQNPSHTTLSSNAITINYIPDSDDCFEMYEILIGENQDNMQSYTNTAQRHIQLTGLEYGKKYYVQIYPLNHKNERTSWQPAQVSFDLPYHETNFNPKITDTTSLETIVSWVSENDEIGWVKYGTDPEDYDNWQIAEDTRGTNISDELHYIRLKPLNSETQYYFEVISGNKQDNNNGQFYQFRTGPPLLSQGSCQPSGKLFADPQMTVPLENAIVYVTVSDVQNSSTGSYLVTPESNGSWQIELVNFRTADNASLLTCNCGETDILVEIQAGKLGTDRMISTAIPYDFYNTDTEMPPLIPDQDHMITITHNGFGNIIPSDSIAVRHHTDLTVFITPDYGYHISDVLVNDQSIGIASAYQLKHISENHSINAVFEIDTFYIQTQSTPGGTITQSAVVDHSFDYTIGILPDEGFYIYNVNVDGVDMGQLESYVFSSITENHSITASFNRYHFSITSEALFGGTVLTGEEDEVLWGESKTYTISANNGYIIYDVFVDGISYGNISVYKFNNVQADHSIRAVFAAKYHFYPGWNLASLSFVPETPLNSKTWAQEIDDSGGKVLIIQTWDGSKWKTYNAGANFGYFSIEPGRGYFLKCDEESTWINTGTKLEETTYQFYEGFNLFGFPGGSVSNTLELAEIINIDHETLLKVQRWTGGGFKTYSVSMPFSKFDITNMEGYFLLFSESGTFEINQ